MMACIIVMTTSANKRENFEMVRGRRPVDNYTGDENTINFELPAGPSEMTNGDELAK